MSSRKVCPSNSTSQGDRVLHPMKLRSHTNKRDVAEESEKNLNRNGNGNGVPFLPIEIIRSIFLLLPVDFLYEVLRLVCKPWRELINDPGFAREHLSLSSTGTLIQTHVPSDTWKTVGHFVETDNNEEKIERKRKRNIRPRIHEGEIILTEEELGKEMIVHSCDGLILLTNNTIVDGRRDYRVVNPTRKECAMIAPLLHPPKATFHNVAIARARAGVEYKVVVPCSIPAEPRSSSSFKVLISTIGSIDNSWREVGDAHHGLPDYKMLASGRHVYWIFISYPAMFALVLDVETETMHEVINGPKGVNLKDTNCCIKSESFLIVAAKRPDFSWEFWGLTDARNGGEWTKLYDVNLSSKLPMVGVRQERHRYAMPQLVVLERDMVVFSIDHCRSFIGYKVKTGHIFKLGRHPAGLVVSGHVRSLVPLFKRDHH